MHVADDAAALERVSAGAAGKENVTADTLAVATQAVKLQPLLAKATELPGVLQDGSSAAADGELLCPCW